MFIAGRASLERDTITLDGPEGRHAATVRRLRPGERVDLTDGEGLVAECVVAAARPGSLDLVVQRRRVEPPPQPRICVIQAIPKGDRGEQAVETMTEVGVDVIVPWRAERCVAIWTRPDRALARWRATTVQAAKQARRAHIPEITEMAATATVASLLGAAACAIVLDPEARGRIGELPLPGSGDIVLVVGPEGGVTPAEAAAFAAAGATGVRLGPAVLRSSTAGTAAAAVLLSRCGRW
ncbi:MAG TPA: 16S rRNA (uracil(1498)-N(3))-methyltransferase [Streptosporangiaceae bacterium]|nr:16S rRNA (uracil(1498)-N(3))-methyltransferase [Streptosporangiaceae bacterium]